MISYTRDLPSARTTGAAREILLQSISIVFLSVTRRLHIVIFAFLKSRLCLFLHVQSWEGRQRQVSAGPVTTSASDGVVSYWPGVWSVSGPGPVVSVRVRPLN